MSWDVQIVFHYGSHFFFPLIVALLFFRTHWIQASLIMLLANAVDLDHLWADPIFDADRCSIGYHFLHSYPAIAIYFLLTLFNNKVVRYLAIGLLLHMLTDTVDCLWMTIFP
jgi:hypothetical protein